MSTPSRCPAAATRLWRFTPLKRLRGLHDGSAPATGSARIEVDRTARRDGRNRAPRRRAARPGRGARRPRCRPGVLVVRQRDDRHRRHATPRWPNRSRSSITGPGEGATAYGHLQIRVEELRRGHRRHRPARQRNLRRQRRIRRRRRGPADGGRRSPTGPTTRCTSARITRRWARTRCCGTSRSPSAATSCG